MQPNIAAIGKIDLDDTDHVVASANLISCLLYTSGLLPRQILKEQINRVLEILIVLRHVHCVEHFQQSGEVLFFLWCFIIDVYKRQTILRILMVIPMTND